MTFGEAFQRLGEEAIPVNNVGDGKIAGAGIGPDGLPGVPKKRKKKVFGDLVRR
jgi:hypothetical protein